jgi:integrase
MRQGELVALRWSDVDLDEAVARVRPSFTGGTLGTPKNRERRDVDLITDVVELLERLRGNNVGLRDELVCPGESGQRSPHSRWRPTSMGTGSARNASFRPRR